MATILIRLRAALMAAALVAIASIACGPDLALAQAAASPSAACNALITAKDAPTVTDAVNYQDDSKTVSLGNIVTVTGERLGKLFDPDCRGQQVVLFFNDWPLTDVKPLPPIDPARGSLHFKLVNRHYDENTKNPWLPILGSPGFTPVPVKVSVGFATSFAMQPTTPNAWPTLQLAVLPLGWFLLWVVIFGGMMWVFWHFVRTSTILRDPGPDGSQGMFSLSRSQGALWFFVILAAYLFIGIVTGDFNDSINSTAVILLGIGAGTVLGSAAVDANKKAAGTAPMTGKSNGYFDDILSDANGISFHRFQMAAWTIVVGIIFVLEVYRNLAMPIFNSTLMGLLGLSAGTYLGLKIPEATTAAKQPG